jgi:hypothetical protein
MVLQDAPGAQGGGKARVIRDGKQPKKRLVRACALVPAKTESVDPDPARI